MLLSVSPSFRKKGKGYNFPISTLTLSRITPVLTDSVSTPLFKFDPPVVGQVVGRPVPTDSVGSHTPNTTLLSILSFDHRGGVVIVFEIYITYTCNTLVIYSYMLGICGFCRKIELCSKKKK